MKKLFFLLTFVISSALANYSWTPVVVLDSNPNTARASVAVDPNGNAVVVWRALLLPAGELIIQAATKMDGQPWSAPEIISPLGELTASPLVHIDAQGNAVAMWVATIGGVDQIRSANKLFGMPWSAPDIVPSSANGLVFDFVMAQDGNVTALWSNGPQQMIASERTLLGAWTAPVTLSAAISVFPQVGIDGSGNVIGAWEENQNIVFARKPFASVVWGPVLTAYGLGGAFAPQISVNLAGDAALIWSGFAGVGTAYIPFNQPVNPFEIIPGSSTDPNSRPNIGLDNSRNALAIWFDLSGVNLTSTKLFGQPWSSPTLLTSAGSQSELPINVNACNLTLISFAGPGGTQMSSGIIGSPFSPPFNLQGGGGPAVIGQNPCGHAIAVVEGSVKASEGFLFSNVTSFSGIQKKNNFGTLSEYENKLRWNINPSPFLAGFRIYRNGSPIAFVKGNEDDYVDPRQVKNQPVEYGITAVDAFGSETSQITTIVP